MIKLVVTDVDNTIIKEGTSRLNPEYFDVIRQLRKKGIMVVIASGRQYASIHRLFKEVEDEIWFIADGGGVIKTDRGIETLSPLSKEWMKECLDFTKTIEGMDLMFCAALVSYAPDGQSEMFQKMINDYKYDIVSLDSWERIPEEPIVKISLYHPNKIAEYAEKYYLPKWKNKDMHTAIAGEWWLDYMMPGMNKGSALKLILERLKLSTENVLATGDNMNDLEMITLAGRGLCVENGNEALKAAADAIIPGYEQDGVLNEWKKLL